MDNIKRLTQNERRKIARKAINMGATSTTVHKYFQYVDFKHTRVDFEFYPLRYGVSFLGSNKYMTRFDNCKFSTSEEAEEIKKDMDLALKFIEYLKQFELQLPNPN